MTERALSELQLSAGFLEHNRAWLYLLRGTHAFPRTLSIYIDEIRLLSWNRIAF